MKIGRLIIGILLLNLIACENSDHKSEDKNQLPRIGIDYSDMPEDKEVKPDTHVND